MDGHLPHFIDIAMRVLVARIAKANGIINPFESVDHRIQLQRGSRLIAGIVAIHIACKLLTETFGLVGDTFAALNEKAEEIRDAQFADDS